MFSARSHLSPTVWRIFRGMKVKLRVVGRGRVKIFIRVRVNVSI